MIEVEVRGKLDEAGYEKLKSFLSSKGYFKGKHKREMYLLYDYPGYDEDPTKREVDIRLRNTDGFCEIMLKNKASDSNHARHEISLPLKDVTLDKAKEIVKALGCKKGLKMVREKEIFDYKGVEWSLVTCPKNIRYYEAELEVDGSANIDQIHQKLIDQAVEVGVKPLSDDEMKEFIFWLDKEVNVEVDF